MSKHDNIFSVTPKMLSDLSSVQAVKIFRDLLWAQARRRNVPATKIRITTEIATADGGVDASVDDDSLEAADDMLVAGGTRYQIKTGKAKPWQESWLKKELFGLRTKVDRKNLGPAVLRCLESGGRYVVVCFGSSPTSDRTLSAKVLLSALFGKCGFPNARVDVWGQDVIIGLLLPYPSLCLNVSRRNELEIRSHASWAMDEDMKPEFALGEVQKQLLEDMRECLRGDVIRHIRLVGEPGLGKTRLALEATRTDDLSPTVIYVGHAEDFQRSRLFNAILQADNEYRVILVIDECPANERASIWNALKQRSDRCQLITIDHDPESSTDDEMRMFQCPPLGEEYVNQIILRYVPGRIEARRWAAFCDGSPRVAHAVGLNLLRNPKDVLKPPATVNLWGRFIDGFGKSGSQRSAHRHLLLRCVSLFGRFGFEPPVDAEAKFIAELATRVNPSLTWGEFQSVARELKQRRILQGKTTLRIVPTLLHVHLWRTYWDDYGSTESLSDLLFRIPGSMISGFVEMLRYAHSSPEGLRQVTGLLGPEGVLSKQAGPYSPMVCKLLNHLAEATPEPTLQFFERTIGQWKGDRLKAQSKGRQDLVWALEKLAVWRTLFTRAAALLLRLAEFEIGSNSNNATGVFVGLFAIAGHGSSEAGPNDRIVALEAALRAPSIKQRAIGLKAAASALRIYNGIRIVGPEHQGLRPTASLWMAGSWDEVHDAFGSVWSLLERVAEAWEKAERTKANDVLIQAARGLVQLEPLAGMVLGTLERLASDEATDQGNLVQFCTHGLRYMGKALPATTIERIRKLDAAVTGATFRSKLRRFAIFSDSDEDWDESGKRTEERQLKLEAIAEEAKANNDEFGAVLPELIATKNPAADSFGWYLGKSDETNHNLNRIKRAQIVAGPLAPTMFFGGYLRGIFAREPAARDRIVAELLADKYLVTRTGDLVWNSGLDNSVIDQMMAEFDRGRLPLEQLRVFGHHADLDSLDRTRINSLLTRLVKTAGADSARLAIEVAACYFRRKQGARPIPKGLGFRILARGELFKDLHGQMDGYYWKEVAEHYIKAYPESGVKIFSALFRKLADPAVMVDFSNSPYYEVICAIIKLNPSRCWGIICPFLDASHSRIAGDIRFWLGNGSSLAPSDIDRPIILFPEAEVMAWVAAAPEQRLEIIGDIVPKTISRSGAGKLTRDMLVAYGDHEPFRRRLRNTFYFGMRVGLESNHYRQQRDTARKWLFGETDPNVISWVESYIEILSKGIERAEIEEEREF